MLSKCVRCKLKLRDTTATTEVVKSLKVMKEKRVNKLFIRLLVWFDPGKMIGLKMKRTSDRECHFPRKKNLIDRPNRTLCKLSKRTYYLWYVLWRSVLVRNCFRWTFSHSCHGFTKFKCSDWIANQVYIENCQEVYK